ncbi:nuclear transport factor 2 family protein [Burkholderia vietnamiensis]|uniref:nuclear transport factor 2 family protein n=1 Tax=Burkholderia vietnamiensis TaxID=60552 RepID=UPI001CF1CD04|nr:nuclear transport factor 2 family protein [Burkholderia vietnamiensis]MCA8229669.1 nuclear transport factor 2 family protein [Burkholderia vietnamiensis]
MNSAREIIEPYEIALRAAMLSNDVDALDTLLDDDLIFTIPTGQIISKHDDLAAHRAKLLRVDTLDLVEMRVQAIGEMIVTATTVVLAGDFDGAAFSGRFAYTRLWRQAGDRWRVAAGHASQISPA